MDYLDKVRDKAYSKMMTYQQKMAEYYNKKVKLRRLDIGDLVLRKVSTATKDCPRKAPPHVGRSLPSRPLLPARQLSPGNPRRTEAPASMEH